MLYAFSSKPQLAEASGAGCWTFSNTMLVLTETYHDGAHHTYTTESESCEEAKQFVQEASGGTSRVIGIRTRIRDGAVRHGDLSSPFFEEEPKAPGV
jgi:hypothetical protein